MKRTNKVFVIILIALLYSIPIISFICLRTHHKMHKSYGPGLTVHLPKTWNAGDRNSSNSDATCTINMNMTTRDIDRIKEEMIPYEMEYTEKKIKDVSMQYGYMETEDEIIHTYIFNHPTIDKNYYLIYTQNRNSEAEDCKEFINQIEDRLVIEY